MKQKPSPQPAVEEPERNNELPEGWVSVQLKDHVYIAGRIGWRGLKRSEYTEVGPLFLAVKDILPTGDVDFTCTGHVSKERYAESPEIQLTSGDILLTKDGTIGKVGMVMSLPSDVTVNSSILVVRPNDRLIYNRFLFHFFRGPQFQEIAHERITGSAIPHLFQKDIKRLSALVPPWDEQHRIVAAVEKLVAQIDAANGRLARVPKILKAFRKSVLAAACSGRLTEDWRESHNAPEWESVVIEDVIVTKPRNGLSVRAVNYKTNVRSLTLTATTSGRFESGHFKYLDVDIPPESHLWLKRGDILLQRGNTEEYVGIAALYDGEDDEYIYPDLMIKIRPKKGVLSEYLWVALSTPKARQYFRENATGSQGSMPKINQTIVENAPILIPSPGEQQEIVRRVEALFKLADKIEKRVEAATRRADKLTQSILAKAFRGELVPTEAELARKEGRTYEPASELLARIRSTREKSAATKSASANRKPHPAPTPTGKR